MHIAVSLKTKFKRHLPGEFHDCSWVFWSRHCSCKGQLGEWKEGTKAGRQAGRQEDDETRFSPFPGSSLLVTI